MEFAHFEEDASEDIQLDVECDAEDWAPIEPEPRPLPDQLHFVDGIRRLESRGSQVASKAGVKLLRQYLRGAVLQAVKSSLRS